MANEDVRVRLSAEGVAQVVGAFKTVSDEAKKSAHDAEGAWSDFGDEIKEIGKELVGFLALGALFDSFKESVAETFEKADAIDDFAKATALSTDAIQGLMAAASKAHVPFDQLEASIGKLNVTIGKARQGSKEALAPFDQLKINFQDLQKLSPDEQFETIVKKLAAVRNPADQAAIGVALFGKQFQAIKPVIDDVAKDGLQSYIDHLRELGILLSGDTVTAMKDVNEQLAELKTRSQGVVTQFVSGMVPALNQGMDAFLEATNSGIDGVKTVGEAVGDVLKGLVLVAVVVGKTIGNVFGAAVKTVSDYTDALSKTVSQVANGDFAAARKTAADYRQSPSNFAQAIKDSQDEARQAYESLFGDSGKKTGDEGHGANGGGTSDDENIARLKALGQARYQLISAQLDSELALYSAHGQLLEEQEKQQYQDGTISLQQYYADRAKIINDQFDKEVEALKKKRAAAASVPTSQNDEAAQLALQAQLAQLDGQIQLKQVARQQALAENTNEQRAAQKQLYTDQLSAEAKLASLQGNRFAASQAQLKIQLQQLDDVLKKGGVSDEARQNALDEARAQAEAMAQFNDQKELADASLKSLTAGIAGVQTDIANGTLYQYEGEQKIIDLEKERLPVLQQIAEAQMAAAQAAKDPQAIAAAETFAQKVRDIAASTNLAGQELAKFKQGEQDAFQNGLAEFLSTSITNIHNLKDAFSSFVTSVLQGLQKIAAQILAEQATRALFGALGNSIAPTPQADYIGSYMPSLTPSAHGNVFSAGHVVKAFAKGGAFTNSIVSQPTVAPMALFGEETDEAIMPLTRDSNGNLGVRSSGAGQSPVQVEVNITNNGQPVQADQTSTRMDGQKVIVDMVVSAIATDISRGGKVAKAGEQRYGWSRPGNRVGGG